MISNPTDPLSMLRDDHQKVKSLFNEYNEMGTAEKNDTVKKISEELAMHTAIEELIIYPKIRQISDEARHLIEESILEHEEIKKHIRELGAGSEQNEISRHMGMMEQSIDKHVQKEESQIFPLGERNLKDELPNLAADMLAFKVKNKGSELLEALKSNA